MLFGKDIDLVEDTKKRRLMQVRKDNTFYLLDKKQEKYVTFLKNNIINAVSIGVMLGYLLKFLNWPWVVWAIVAVVWYVSYVVLFNTKVFPKFKKLKEKKVKVVPPSTTKGKTLAFALAFLFIGIALLACVPMGQTTSETESVVVIGCGFFSIVMGLKFLGDYRKA